MRFLSSSRKTFSCCYQNLRFCMFLGHEINLGVDIWSSGRHTATQNLFVEYRLPPPRRGFSLSGLEGSSLFIVTSKIHSGHAGRFSRLAQRWPLSQMKNAVMNWLQLDLLTVCCFDFGSQTFKISQAFCRLQSCLSELFTNAEIHSFHIFQLIKMSMVPDIRGTNLFRIIYRNGLITATGIFWEHSFRWKFISNSFGVNLFSISEVSALWRGLSKTRINLIISDVGMEWCKGRNSSPLWQVLLNLCILTYHY